MPPRRRLSLPMHQSQSPRFWEIDEYRFEEMCAALLDKEPDVRLGSCFGDRGQKQFGADIVGDLVDGGLIVAQCKCYEVFPPAKIDKAAKAFRDHLAYWQAKDTKRFVLMVAPSMNERRRREMCLHWKGEFAKHGISFEMWDQDVLANRLGPHRTIVSRYLHESWVEPLCGRAAGEYGAAQGQGMAALSLSLDRLVSGEVERAETLFFAGRPKSALRQIKSLRDDSAAWLALPPERQAALLRTEVQIRLTLGEVIDPLIALADQADALAPPKSGPVLRALIAWSHDGAEAALAVLAGHDQNPVRQIRALLLARLGRFAEAEGELAAWGDEVETETETWRVRALARLAEGDVESALVLAENAVRLAPQSRRMRELYANLLFFNALARNVVPTTLDYMPSPVDWLMVRRDDVSRQRLQQAEEIFTALLAECELSADDQTQVRLWRLVCLCCQAERRDDAESEAVALLHEDRTNPLAIAWALARNLNFNRERSRKALEDLRDAGRAEFPHILALVAIHHSAGQRDKALRALDAGRPLFVKAGHDGLWQSWHDHLSDSLPEAAPSDPAQMSIDVLLGNCLTRAQQGDHDFVADHAERLCREIGTADVVTLAAQSCLNANRLEGYEAILSQWSGCFPGGQIPLELRRAKVASQFQRGDVEDALIEAGRLAVQSPDVGDTFRLADLHRRIGDVSEMARVLKPLAGRSDLPADPAVQFSYLIAGKRPDIARQLLGSVDPAKISPEYLVMGYLAANRLGASQELAPMMAAFHQAMDTTGLPGVIKGNDLDHLKRITLENHDAAQRSLAMLQAGRMPVHLLTDVHNVPMTNVSVEWMAKNRDRDGWPISSLVPIRHGGRAPVADFPQSPSEWRLHVDLTSLLLASEIGLLDAVEQCFGPIFISEHVPTALFAMADQMQLTAARDAKNTRSRWVDKLRDHVARQIQDGGYRFARTCRQAGRDDETPGVDQAVIEDMMLLEQAPGTVVWCDDRMINGHKTIGGTAPILSIQDILDALRQYGHLSEDEHWRMLLRLREGNVAFLLPCQEEILYWLKRASVHAGRVVETPELTILRRNFACAVAGPLQGPNQDPEIGNTNGELLFAFRCRGVVGESLIGCFDDNAHSRETVMARADWIWTSLWVDIPPQWGAWGRDPAVLDEMVATSFAGHFFSALALAFNGPDNPRARYLQWLRLQVIESRLLAQPALFAAMVDRLAHILDATYSDVKTEAEQAMMRRYLGRFVDDLPDMVARPLRQHPSLRPHLAEISQTVNTLGPHHFISGPLIDAVSAAANGKPASVTSQGGVTFTVSRQDVGTRLHLLFSSASTKVGLTGVANGALLESSAERRAYLQIHGAEFDLTDDGLRVLIDEVEAIADPGKRVERVNAAVTDTCSHRYELVQSLLRSNHEGNFPMDQLLPPSLDSMLRFLRLDPADPAEILLERAAERLLDDVGLAEALWRLSSLPVPLPLCLITAARALPKAELRQLVRAWARRPTSQLSMLHLIRLLVEIEVSVAGLGRRIHKHLSNPRRSELHAPLMDTVGWAYHLFLHLPDYRDLPYAVRLALAWCHGEKLFSAFLAADRYVSVTSPVSVAKLAEQGRYGVDVTFKRHLSEPLFLFQGLAYALGGHGPAILGGEGMDLLRTFLAPTHPDISVALVFHRVMQAAPNVLGSFFGAPLEQTLAALGFAETAATVLEFRDAGHTIMQQPDSSPWNWLIGLYPHGRPPQAVADRVRQALLSTNIWSLCQIEAAGAWNLLSYLAEIAGWLAGSDGIDHVRDQIFKAAEQLGTGTPDTTARQTLVHALAILACFTDDPVARSNRLAEDARTLAEKCPAAAREGRVLLRHLMEDLDIQELGQLTEALLELRAYR